MATFDDWVWTNLTALPSFFDRVSRRPSLPPYRYVKKTLQYLQWQDGGKRDRPWVLKGVGHAANLDSLLDCYPNATLVQPHRDPLDTIPSYAKLETGIWEIQANPLDPHHIGRETLRMWKWAIDRCLDARDRLGLNGRIVDVDYEQVRTDPMSVMRAVYRQAGREMSAEAEGAMRTWHETNEQGSRGAHVYSLAEFGLTAEQVDETFAEYIKRFIAR